MTGLFYVVGIVLVMPAVGTVMNVVLSGLFTSLQVTLTYEVIISTITTIVAALVMVTSVRVVALLNSIGVVLEMVVLLGAAIGLLFHNHQSLSVLTTTGGVAGQGQLHRAVPGRHRARGHPARRVRDRRRVRGRDREQSRIKPSQAIIAGLGGTALVLFIFDLALILSLPNVKDGDEQPRPDPVRADRRPRDRASRSCSWSAR